MIDPQAAPGEDGSRQAPAPVVIAAVPPNDQPPADPDQPIGDDQPDSDDQRSGYQPGAWARIVLNFARANPEYLQELTAHELAQQLQQLDGLAQTPQVRDNSALAEDVAALTGMVAAELRTCPAGPPIEGEALSRALSRVNAERVVHVLLDAIPAGEPAQRLAALRTDVLDQLRATGGVQLPAGGQRWGRNDVPGWVGTLLDVTQQVIDDPATPRRPPAELAGQREALYELAGRLPFDQRLLRASALLARLDAIGVVTNDPDRVSGSSDEDLRLACSRPSFEWPGRTPASFRRGPGGPPADPARRAPGQSHRHRGGGPRA